MLFAACQRLPLACVAFVCMNTILNSCALLWRWQRVHASPRRETLLSFRMLAGLKQPSITLTDVAFQEVNITVTVFGSCTSSTGVFGCLTFFTLASFSFSRASLILSAFICASMSSWARTIICDESAGWRWKRYNEQKKCCCSTITCEGVETCLIWGCLRRDGCQVCHYMKSSLYLTLTHSPASAQLLRLRLTDEVRSPAKVIKSRLAWPQLTVPPLHQPSVSILLLLPASLPHVCDLFQTDSQLPHKSR